MIETGLLIPPYPSASERRHRLLAIHDERIRKILRDIPGGFARLDRAYSGRDSAVETPSQLRSPGAAAAPWLFWETFKSLDDELFLDIAEAGVCHLIASVVLDHLVDDQLPDRAGAAKISQVLTDWAKALFERLYSADSEFWVHFDRLTVEHRSALSTELRCRADPRQFTYAALQEIGRGKVCPGVTTIVAMSVSSGQDDVFADIEESLKDVAVASQLVDDVRDWRIDLDARHLTYFLAGLAPTEAWTEDDWPAAEKVESWVQAERRDIESMRHAIESLDEATRRVHDVYCPAWTNYIHTKRMDADRMLSQLLMGLIFSGLPEGRKSSAARSEPSNQGEVREGKAAVGVGKEVPIDGGTASADPRTATDRVARCSHSLQESCEAALLALLAAQRYDGSWIDFDLGDAEGSDVWVTAHIGLQLATLPGWEPDVERSQALEKAGSYLMTKWRHGWAYNDLAPVDADSTAHAILFLHAIGGRIPPSTFRALAAHQQPDGGFATYIWGRAEKIPRNWCRSHPDVTPVVIWALSVIGEGCAESMSVRHAVEKIALDREGDRPWPAFWWDLRWYTSAAWSRAMLALGSECAGFRWPNDLSLALEDVSLLDAALLLEVAINSGRRQLASEIVELLKTSQLDNGLWPIRPILRQPSEEVEHPWQDGQSCKLYADIHGLYSAATILNHLTMYEYSFGEH